MCSLQLLGCGSSEVIIYFSRDSIQPAPILDHRLEDNSVAVPPNLNFLALDAKNPWEPNGL